MTNNCIVIFDCETSKGKGLSEKAGYKQFMEGRINIPAMKSIHLQYHVSSMSVLPSLSLATRTSLFS